MRDLLSSIGATPIGVLALIFSVLAFGQRLGNWNSKFLAYCCGFLAAILFTSWLAFFIPGWVAGGITVATGILILLLSLRKKKLFEKKPKLWTSFVLVWAVICSFTGWTMWKHYIAPIPSVADPFPPDNKTFAVKIGSAVMSKAGWAAEGNTADPVKELTEIDGILYIRFLNISGRKQMIDHFEIYHLRNGQYAHVCRLDTQWYKDVYNLDTPNKAYRWDLVHSVDRRITKKQFAPDDWEEGWVFFFFPGDLPFSLLPYYKVVIYTADGQRTTVNVTSTMSDNLAFKPSSPSYRGYKDLSSLKIVKTSDCD